MRNGIALLGLAAIAVASRRAAALLVGRVAPSGRCLEPPGGAADRGRPDGDNTDLYAFVTPDKPDTVDDRRELHPARGAGRRAELRAVRRRRPLRDPRRQQRRRARTTHLPVPVQDRIRNPNTFLYNTGPIGSTDARPERPADLHAHPRRRARRRCVDVARRLPVPPANVGPRSTPNYDAFASGGDQRSAAARRSSRASATTRSSSTSARSSTWAASSVQRVHLIALPAAGRGRRRRLQRAHDRPAGADRTDSSLHRARTAHRHLREREPAEGQDPAEGRHVRDERGRWVQVSRLGNPLVNEVVIPLGEEGSAGTRPIRADDEQFEKYYAEPELAGLDELPLPGLPDAPTTNRRISSLFS